MSSVPGESWRKVLSCGVLSLMTLLAACGDDTPSGPQQQTLRVLSTSESPGTTRKLALVGETLYLAAEDSGLVIWNVADPREPIRLGSLVLAGSAYHVAVAGNYAYVATRGGGGLAVVQVSDPSNPVLMASVPIPDGCAERMAIQGQLGLVATCDSGLVVLDVSAPVSPSLAGTLARLGSMYDARFVPACVSANLAVATGDSTLYLIDLTTPSAPSVKDSLALSDLIYGIFVDGMTVYAANRYAGIAIVNVGCDGRLTLVGSLSLPGNARDVVVVGNRAYVASSEDSALYVVVVANPMRPALEQALNLASSKGVEASAHYVFLAGDSGFTILRYE